MEEMGWCGARSSWSRFSLLARIESPIAVDTSFAIASSIAFLPDDDDNDDDNDNDTVVSPSIAVLVFLVRRRRCRRLVLCCVVDGVDWTLSPSSSSLSSSSLLLLSVPPPRIWSRDGYDDVRNEGIDNDEDECDLGCGRMDRCRRIAEVVAVMTLKELDIRLPPMTGS